MTYNDPSLRNGRKLISNPSFPDPVFNPRIPPPAPLPIEAPLARSDRGRFRYSGDLELELPFERNPTDKPSNDFKNVQSWFKVDDTIQAKSGPETTSDDPNSNSSIKNNTGIFRSSLQYIRSSFIYPQRQERPVQPHSKSNLEYNDNNTVENPTYNHTDYQSPSIADVTPSTINDNSTKNSNISKRPFGPRNIGGSTLNTSYPLSTSLPIHIPLPPLHRQLRIWVYSIVAGFSLFSTVLSVYLIAKYNQDTRLNFFLFTSSATLVLSITCLVCYVWLGARLFNYFEAPFLFCQDLPNNTTSSSGISPYDFYQDCDDKDVNKLTKTLTRLGPLRREIPSAWVPLTDLFVHILMTIFWVATLVDVSTHQARCLSSGYASFSVCQTVVSALIFGGIAACVVSISVVFKAWEMYRFRIGPAVVKRHLTISLKT